MEHQIEKTMQDYFERYSEIVDKPVYDLTLSEADELVKLKWKFFTLKSNKEYELAKLKQELDDTNDDNMLTHKWQINEKTGKAYTEKEIEIIGKDKKKNLEKITLWKIISLLEWNIKTIDSKVPIIRDWCKVPVTAE